MVNNQKNRTYGASLVRLRPSCGGSTYKAGSSQKRLFDSNAFHMAEFNY